MRDQHQHLDDRLDRYLDGLMDEAQRTEFEQLLDHDDELRAQVDQQRNIDNVLNRLFKPTAASEVISATSHASAMANGAAPEPAIVEPTLTFQQGPSSASQHVTRLRARSFALAASLAMALVGSWLIWGALVPRPGYPEWRTMEVAFNEFAAKRGEFAFSKTAIPIQLLRYGQEQLVSRSQAKRLLARFDRFEVVVLDFKGISTIGQAFADEIFRVFPGSHPETSIRVVNASVRVRRTIARVSGNRSD